MRELIGFVVGEVDGPVGCPETVEFADGTRDATNCVCGAAGGTAGGMGCTDGVSSGFNSAEADGALPAIAIAVPVSGAAAIESVASGRGGAAWVTTGASIEVDVESVLGWPRLVRPAAAIGGGPEADGGAWARDTLACVTAGVDGAAVFLMIW